MTLLDACLWGLSGAGAIEVIELYSSIKTKKDFPWRLPGELPLELFLFCAVIRLALGVFAAVLCANGGQLSVAGAVAAGIAAPKVLEQLGRLPVAASLAAVSLSGSSTSESADTTETPPSEGGSVDEA